MSLSDNAMCKVHGRGTIRINRLIHGEWRAGRIDNVLYVPDLKKNLFSVGVCAKKGYDILFKGNNVVFKRNNQIQALGYKCDTEVYLMFFEVIPPHATSKEANACTSSLLTWHKRLGHVNIGTIKGMINAGIIKNVKVSPEDSFFCESCQFGKSHRLPFKKHGESNLELKVGEFIHSDVCGPFSQESIGGARYFLSFIDEASGYRHVYFLRG